ncbi:MAG TPA: hypothetical protein VFM49_09735 [Chloroflexia bacterium]|jgi:hypothetical protein|nr:hypothetical protein [Chloroflexia bacterium]
MEAQASVIVYKGPAVLERAVLAAGMAGAVLASQLLPNYPMEWRALLPLAVLGIGLWSTIGAYLAMVAVLAYPIWQLSPYLMVLFVAVAIIPHRLILNHLPLALLIVWSPVLAALHVEFAIPLLAGIFSGTRRGAVAGLVTALWIKLYAAMSGNPLDLLLLQGSPGTPAGVAARFAGAGSLDTVMLISAPFAPNSSELLGNLLQIAAVAGAGAAAGWLAGWGRSRLVLRDLEDAPPLWLRLAARVWWTGIVPVGVGAIVLGAALLLVPFAVGRPLSSLGLQNAANLLSMKLVLSSAAVLGLIGLVLVAQPLPPSARRPVPRERIKPAAPPVLPPPDLTPIKTGRFVPAWAAQAGMETPLPPATEPADENDDLIDLLMAVPAASPADDGDGPAGAMRERAGSAGAGVTPAPGPPPREIAIELD